MDVNPIEIPTEVVSILERTRWLLLQWTQQTRTAGRRASDRKAAEALVTEITATLNRMR